MGLHVPQAERVYLVVQKDLPRAGDDDVDLFLLAVTMSGRGAQVWRVAEVADPRSRESWVPFVRCLLMTGPHPSVFAIPPVPPALPRRSTPPPARVASAAKATTAHRAWGAISAATILPISASWAAR